MKAITIIICMTFSSFATYKISNDYHHKTLETRVFNEFGEGDMGCEMLYYLETGDTTVFGTALMGDFK